MDTLLKILGISFIGTILAILLKEKTPQLSMALSLLTGLFIFHLILEPLSQIIEHMKELVAKSGADSNSVSLILKICGVGIISEYFCNTICDAGETAIAKKAELAAKVLIFAMVLPLIGKVVETVWSLF